MRLLAALGFGICAALVAGALVGMPLQLRSWRPRRRAGRESWNERLQRSGASVTAAQFVAGSVAAGFATIALVDALTGSVFVGIVPAIAIAALPGTYFARRRATLVRDVQAAWPDALRDLLASIAAGRSLAQGCHELGEHGPGPLRDAFAEVSARARMTGLGPALEAAKEDLADPVSDRVLEVMLLAEETGGSIVRVVLGDLVASITKDLEVADQIETDGLEMRINARSVVALPWVVLVALTTGHGPFRDFYRSGGGVATIGIGLILSAVGFILVSRLARTPPEPRVLNGSGQS
jgi:tight adherence protein B